MNPFDNFDSTAITYNDFVFNQVLDMKIGDSKKVDVGGKKVISFRVAMQYIEKTKLKGAKFKSRVDADGNLWVLRVK